MMRGQRPWRLAGEEKDGSSSTVAGYGSWELGSTASRLCYLAAEEEQVGLLEGGGSCRPLSSLV
jgi:hypothetical protein